MQSTGPLRPRPQRLRSAAPAGLAALLAALAIAGCGSSKHPTGTIGVGNESSSLPPEETSTTASSVQTPTSGPLSKEPKVTPPTGPAPKKLETKELIEGTGAVAEKGDTVTVNYVGVLYKTGKVFDASWHRKETFSFTLGAGEVIHGWEQGVVGMHVGGRRELIIPSNLGYGSAGSGSTIPPNETLVFVVDLLGA